MQTNVRYNAGVQFQVLSESQCEQIVMAAYEVLERVGTKMYEPVAIETSKNPAVLYQMGIG